MFSIHDPGGLIYFIFRYDVSSSYSGRSQRKESRIMLEEHRIEVNKVGGTSYR